MAMAFRRARRSPCGNPYLDEQSVGGFQIGEADPLRRCRVITDVAVFVRIIALPFGGGFPYP